MALPYENATSGKKAIDDMQTILQQFGCGSFGQMMDFDKSELLVQFTYRGRQVSVRANASGDDEAVPTPAQIDAAIDAAMRASNGDCK